MAAAGTPDERWKFKKRPGDSRQASSSSRGSLERQEGLQSHIVV
jgi:hypothetical protein